MSPTQFLAIKINDRFFNGFGKNNRIQTAWSMAGAKAYLNSTDVSVDIKKIKVKYKSAIVIRCDVSFETVANHCAKCQSEHYLNSELCLICTVESLERFCK